MPKWQEVLYYIQNMRKWQEAKSIRNDEWLAIAFVALDRTGIRHISHADESRGAPVCSREMCTVVQVGLDLKPHSNFPDTLNGYNDPHTSHYTCRRQSIRLTALSDFSSFLDLFLLSLSFSFSFSTSFSDTFSGFSGLFCDADGTTWGNMIGCSVIMRSSSESLWSWSCWDPSCETSPSSRNGNPRWRTDLDLSDLDLDLRGKLWVARSV